MDSQGQGVCPLTSGRHEMVPALPTTRSPTTIPRLKRRSKNKHFGGRAQGVADTFQGCVHPQSEAEPADGEVEKHGRFPLLISIASSKLNSSGSADFTRTASLFLVLQPAFSGAVRFRARPSVSYAVNEGAWTNPPLLLLGKRMYPYLRNECVQNLASRRGASQKWHSRASSGKASSTCVRTVSP